MMLCALTQDREKLTCMLEHVPAIREITEEQLAEDQPRVRALLLQRLERTWDWVQARLDDDAEGTRPLDPRVAEIGLRVIKEEAGLYRLGRPLPVVEEEDDQFVVLDPRELMLKQLVDVEARLQGRDAA
jgi:hypothetical protein